MLQEVEGRGFDRGVRRGGRRGRRMLGYGGEQRRRIVARRLVMLVVMKFLVMMVFGRDGFVMRWRRPMPLSSSWWQHSSSHSLWPCSSFSDVS